MTNIYFHKENGRYYAIYINKDMLGDYILTCVWGSRHNRLGNHKHHCFASLDDLRPFLDEIIKKRKMRGYKMVN